MQEGADAKNGICKKGDESGRTHPHRKVLHFEIREQGQMHALAEFRQIAGGSDDQKQEVCENESGRHL